MRLGRGWESEEERGEGEGEERERWCISGRLVDHQSCVARGEGGRVVEGRRRGIGFWSYVYLGRSRRARGGACGGACTREVRRVRAVRAGIGGRGVVVGCAPSLRRAG